MTKINIEEELLKQEYHKIVSLNPLLVVNYKTYKGVLFQKEVIVFTKEHREYIKNKGYNTYY